MNKMNKWRLRLKVWQALVLCLVLTLVAIPLCLPSLGYLGLGRVVSLWDKELADVYYARSVEEYGPGSLTAALHRMDTATQALSGYARIVRVQQGGSMGFGSYMTDKSLDQLERDYALLHARTPGGDRMAQYTLQVAMSCFFSGRTQRALELVEGIPPVADDKLQELVLLHRAAMLASLGRQAETTALLDGGPIVAYAPVADFIRAFQCVVADDGPGYRQYRWTDNRAPNWDLARVAPQYSSLLEPLMGFYDIQTWDNTPQEELRKSAPKGTNRVTGQVVLSSPGLPLFVSLVPGPNGMGFSSNQLLDYQAVAVASVAPDGSYTMENVPDGKYTLALSAYTPTLVGVSTVLDDQPLVLEGGAGARCADIRITRLTSQATVALEGDRIVMEAQDLPPAPQYQLVLKRRVTIQGATYAEPLYIAPPSATPAVSFSPQQVELLTPNTAGPENPASYLPALYGEQVYAVEVRGLDENGALLYSTGSMTNAGQYETACSSGTLTFSPWTEADRLLLAGSFQQAIPLYEAAAEAGDQNAHRILYSLFSSGYGEGTHDFARAAKHLEAILGQATTEEAKLQLGLALMDAGENARALALLAQVTPTDGYPTRTMGTLRWRLGEPGAALALWRQALAADTSGYWDDILVRAAMVLGKPEWREDPAFLAPLSPDSIGAMAAFAAEDLTPYRDFFALTGRGQLQEAKALLQGDTSPLGVALQIALLSFEADFRSSSPEIKALGALLPAESPYRAVLSVYFE